MSRHNSRYTRLEVCLGYLERGEEGDYLSLGSSGKAELWASCLFWVLNDAKACIGQIKVRGAFQTQKTVSAKVLRYEKAWCIWEK